MNANSMMFNSLNDVVLFVKSASNAQLRESAQELADFINALPDDKRVKVQRTIGCLLGWESFDSSDKDSQAGKL